MFCFAINPYKSVIKCFYFADYLINSHCLKHSYKRNLRFMIFDYRKKIFFLIFFFKTADFFLTFAILIRRKITVKLS